MLIIQILYTFKFNPLEYVVLYKTIRNSIKETGKAFYYEKEIYW